MKDKEVLKIELIDLEVAIEVASEAASEEEEVDLEEVSVEEVASVEIEINQLTQLENMMKDMKEKEDHIKGDIINHTEDHTMKKIMKKKQDQEEEDQ
jgi:AMMECR1 domain-containing protein